MKNSTLWGLLGLLTWACESPQESADTPAAPALPTPDYILTADQAGQLVIAHAAAIPPDKFLTRRVVEKPVERHAGLVGPHDHQVICGWIPVRHGPGFIDPQIPAMDRQVSLGQADALPLPLPFLFIKCLSH